MDERAIEQVAKLKGWNLLKKGLFYYINEKVRLLPAEEAGVWWAQEVGRGGALPVSNAAMLEKVVDLLSSARNWSGLTLEARAGA